jgi:hypothetical protein
MTPTLKSAGLFTNKAKKQAVGQKPKQPHFAGKGFWEINRKIMPLHAADNGAGSAVSTN